MWFKSLLLKIETGQQLTRKQIKRLAKKLSVDISIIRSVIYAFLVVLFIMFTFIGFDGGKEPISDILAFIIAGAILISGLLIMILPKRIRIKKYLESVEKYFETRFKDLDDFDLFYIGQHVNPHIRLLKTPKVYLLSDGYHFLFVSDPFINTQYKMPKYLSFNKREIFLKVINKEVYETDQIMVRLEDVETFYLSSSKRPECEEVRTNNKYKYFNLFFDNDQKFVESCIVLLKLKGGVIFRLSHEVYPIFQNLMGHKERTYD